MKIAKKLYVLLLLACVAGNVVGCGSITNITKESEEVKKQDVIAPNVYYSLGNDTFNKFDINTGESTQVGAKVLSWEVVGDKVYYVTGYDYKDELTEEDKTLSQNELYVMDLDGNNKTKVLGREQINNPQKITGEYILYYNMLGHDKDYVYFTMRQTAWGTSKGCNVVYRINVKNNAVEQVSDVLDGAMNYFYAMENHFYYTWLIELGAEWGNVIGVDCKTKESNLLTDYGRTVENYKNETYYVDMKDYKDDQASGAQKVGNLYKISPKKGDAEKAYDLHFMDEVPSNEESYSYFDLKIEGDYLNTYITTYQGEQSSTKIEKVSLKDGTTQSLDEPANMQGKTVLGQNKEKLYYIELDETGIKEQLVCSNMKTGEKEVLVGDIEVYRSDVTGEEAEQLNESLIRDSSIS